MKYTLKLLIELLFYLDICTLIFDYFQISMIILFILLIFSALLGSMISTKSNKEPPGFRWGD